MTVQIRGDELVYPCGCRFKIIQHGPPIRVQFDPHMEALPLDCSLTWGLLGEGNTKGVFQLETRLGQQSAKNLRPSNIEELAALTAIMRPGCLQAKRSDLLPNGEEGPEKSVTDHYMDRKNGREEVVYPHPALEPILRSTYGEMIYQEQAMQIAQLIAGFDLQQADVLRKAIGKKKADIMAKVKVEFIEGCKKVGLVSEAEAAEIFGQIEKSQRYSFNKSHSVSYAINGYLSAYAKAHFPIPFFTSYLHFSKDKQKKFDEIKLLVANARVMGIKVCPPDFRHTNKHFKRIEKQLYDNDTYDVFSDTIYFGFADIKNVGDSAMKKIDTAIYQIETALGKHRERWSWVEFLMYFSQEIASTAITGMIETGALDYFNLSRQRMLFEYSQYCELTQKEQAWIKQNLKNSATLSDLLTKALAIHNNGEQGKFCANKNRITKIEILIQAVDNPPYKLEDSPDWIARVEEARLGISLTASVLDGCKNAGEANCTVLEYLNHATRNSGIFLAVQIDEVKTHMTKDNKEMAFVTVNDGEATLDCVVFPDTWEELQHQGLCIKENTVMISGERSRQKDSFVIKKMWQLT